MTTRKDFDDFLSIDSPVVVFDLDNCLSNDAWRIKDIDWSKENPDERYAPYHALCRLDRPANQAVFRAFAKVARPVFLTARPDTVRAETEEWLARHFDVKSPILLMREAGDHRHSVELKRIMMACLPSTPMMAFDDRMDVCDMYDAMGIPTTRMFIHDVCAMTPPTARRHDFYKTGDAMPPRILAQIADGMTGLVTLPWCKTCGAEGQATESACPGPEPMPLAPPSRGDAIVPQPKKKPAGTADALEAMAATFRQRQAIYGSNYKMVGPLMAIMFPDGVPAALLGAAQFHLFELVLVKLSRLAVSGLTHEDSAHDAGVYCAMIESIMKENAK